MHVPFLFGWRVRRSFFSFFKYIFWRFTVYFLLPVGITVFTVGVAPAIMSDSWCRIDGAETKSRIAHFIAILLMNSCCSQIFSEAPIIYSPSKLVWNAHVQFKAVFNLTKVSSELCLTKRTIGRKRIILLYKLECLIGISTNTQKNRIFVCEILRQFHVCLRSPISCCHVTRSI